MNIVSCDHGLWLVALRKYKRHIEYMPHCLLYVPFNFIVFALYRNYEFIPQARPLQPFSFWLVALRKYKRHIEYMPHCLLYVPFNFIVFALYRNYEFIPQARPLQPFSFWEDRAGAPPLWLHQLQFLMT